MYAATTEHHHTCMVKSVTIATRKGFFSRKKDDSLLIKPIDLNCDGCTKVIDAAVNSIFFFK